MEQVKKAKMPGGIPYIVGNEVAERFSFYGMKSILTIFMTSYLLGPDGEPDPMDDNESQIWFHLFSMSVYFFPLIGALVSDIAWGKYRTIIILSIVYCAGHIALAMDETRLGLSLGLTMIAIGSGGIKPCVSAHVGDQFTKENSHLIEKVFGYFYFSINLGSTAAFILIPRILHTTNEPQLAFGIPGGLMIIATFLFWWGRTKFTAVPPAKQRFLKDLKSTHMRKVLGKLLLLNLLLSFFWSLYDQSGSSWVNQAKSDLMDKTISIFGAELEILPSEVGSINPILVMIFIPLFTFVVYPVLNRFFKVTPMKKISIGMFITAFSFLLMTWVQHQMDQGYSMSIGWQLLAYVIITVAEVMIYQTALELSYTQAPNSMKSLIMAFLMLSISFGNAITAMVNVFIRNDDGSAKLEGSSYFMFFVIMMIVVAVIFIPYAMRYKEQRFIQGEDEEELLV